MTRKAHTGSQTLGVSYGSIPPGNEQAPLLEYSDEEKVVTSDYPVHFDVEADVTSRTSTASSLEEISYGDASRFSEIANISKNLIGCGVYSLSGGIAIYANHPQAVLSATFWIAASGTIFGFFCRLIAKLCKMTHSVTYRECWQKTMGKEGALAVAVVNAMNPLMACLAYSTILSEAFQSLFETVGVNVTRVGSLLIITVATLLPLCLMKNLSVLAPFSFLGTAGVVFSAMALLVRYFDGSYQPGGRFYYDISQHLRPEFGNVDESLSPKVLPLVCMLFNSFLMHYNCPRYIHELRDPTMSRFTQVVIAAFGLSVLLCIAIASAGFLTFGEHSDAFILNNYSAQDPLATFCRVAVAFSTLLAFPLVFIGLRDGVLDIFEAPVEEQTTDRLNILTILLLTVVTCIACFVDDLVVINAVTGGVFATGIVFIFPTAMFREAVIQKESLADGAGFLFHRSSHQKEMLLSYVLMVFGVVVGLIGTWNAIR
jgi:amino acid permease